MHEQLKLIDKHLPVALIGTFVTDSLAALVIYFTHIASNYVPLLLSWWLGEAVLLLGVWLLWMLFWRRESHRISDTAARNALIFCAFTVGLLWAMLAMLFFDASPEQTARIAGLVGLQFGIAGGGVASISALFPVYLAFILPCMLSWAFFMLLSGVIYYQILGAGVILLVVIDCIFARNVSKNTRQSIELRFENLALVERLKEKTEQAEQANLAKSKFLAAASHDLRQPIHAQGLFLEILTQTKLSKKQLNIIDNIRNSAAASAEMLNALLDFSRIEAGVINPRLQRFALQPLLNKIENDLAPQADAKGLIYRTRDTHISVYSDPHLLELILRNLVSNAIRYTERGGMLIACRRRGHEALIEVWDTGMGIHEDQWQEIFREFHQLGNPERDRRKGLGLGLAITEKLAQTLNHKLCLHSKYGRGSVFKLALPYVEMDAPSAESIAILSNATPTQAFQLNAHILMIEDDESIRIGTQHLFQSWGATCDTAETIEEALAIALKHPPQIIVSDYRLRSHRNGEEAIRILRDTLGYKIPAIILTGDTAPKRLIDAELSGIPLLHKPATAQDLYLCMTQQLTQDPAPQ
ncbi:MAG: hybrid sensor histidine kinase/response regulator [Methylotenera sp.]|nr:hybrid sensor histidine kinase/response regulator [Methylotenera sp.]